MFLPVLVGVRLAVYLSECQCRPMGTDSRRLATVNDGSAL